MPLLAALAAILLLAACVADVASIRDDDSAALEQGEGFLLLEVDTQRDLASITIVGPRSIRLTRADLQTGSNFILLNLPAGDYRIERVALNDWFYFDMDDDLWRFAVEKDVISYVGNLTFKGYVWGVGGDFILVNRSSFALEYLEDRYPGLLASRGIVYRGPGEDRFFSLVTGR